MARKFSPFKLSGVGKNDCRISRIGAITGKKHSVIFFSYLQIFMEKVFSTTFFGFRHFEKRPKCNPLITSVMCAVRLKPFEKADPSAH